MGSKDDSESSVTPGERALEGTSETGDGFPSPSLSKQIRRAMALARSPDYRRPQGMERWLGFLRILGSFFHGVSLEGKRVLDVGAGHYQLSAILAEEGAVTLAVERDPALSHLGPLLGFDVVGADVATLAPGDLDGPVDGLFSKYSLRTFECGTAGAMRASCDRLDSLITDDGWGWIAPWNGLHGKCSAEQRKDVANAQIRRFAELGWDYRELSEAEARWFQVKGPTPTFNRPLFTRGLQGRPVTSDDRFGFERLMQRARFRAIARAIGETTDAQPSFSHSEFRVAVDILLGRERLARAGTIANVGPGFYDLEDMGLPDDCVILSVENDAEMARARGATYRVIECDVLELTEERLGGPVGGLLSMAAIDATSALTLGDVTLRCERLDAVIRPGGWGCVVPRNLQGPRHERAAAQRQRFIELGWQCRPLTGPEASMLGLRSGPPSWSIFAKGIDDLEPRLARLRAEAADLAQ